MQTQAKDGWNPSFVTERISARQPGMPPLMPPPRMIPPPAKETGAGASGRSRLAAAETKHPEKAMPPAAKESIRDVMARAALMLPGIRERSRSPWRSQQEQDAAAEAAMHIEDEGEAGGHAQPHTPEHALTQTQQYEPFGNQDASDFSSRCM